MQGKAEKEIIGKAKKAARSDEQYAGSDRGRIIATEKAEEVEPNRIVDNAAVNVRPDWDQLPNANADEGANESLEKVQGLLEKTRK